MYFKSLIVFTFFIFLTSVYLIATSEAKIIEKILVIVNDDIITKVEFDDRLAKTKEQLRMVYRYDEERLTKKMEELKPEIMESVIDEILFIQEAIKKNIQVPDSKVQEEIDSIKKQYGSDKAFEEALTAEGYTLDSLKKERKRILLLQSLIEQKFESELRITDDEVRKFYRENRDQFPSSSDSVKLKHILIKFNVTKADKDKARLRAESIREQCIEGADFGEMVKKFSDDAGTKASGGDIGYFFPGTGEYYSELEDAASKLAVGEISDLIESPNGYDIIKITDKKDNAVKAQIIRILAWPDPTEEKSVEDKVNSILEELKNGADFADLVKKYSEDPLTRDKGGDWDYVPIDKMAPELRGAFDKFNVGEISRPVKTPYGIHIFKIIERRDLTDEEMEQLRKFLTDKRLQEKLNEYSKKLRDSAYILKIAEY